MEITTRRPGSPGSPSFTTYLPYEVSHRRPASPAASSSLGYSSSSSSLDEYRLGWDKRDGWLSKDEWRAHRGVQLSCLSPTMSTVIKTRSPSPTRSRSSSRPSTPTFWRSDEPPPYKIDRSRPAVPLTWKPSGSHRFPVAWLDSAALAEPLKPPNLIPTLRPSSSALKVGTRRPSTPPPHIRVDDAAALAKGRLWRGPPCSTPAPWTTCLNRFT